ncbi:MAG TPA: hypothetical protein VK826_06915 [Bacteroidia bacterium]|nr:hypothetical protein [Bacteroidia bacterium]
MKTIFRILPLVSAILLFSCSKEELPATTPVGNSTVHVEYRVSAISGDMTVYQLVPALGTSVEEKHEINRSTYTYSFDVTSGTLVRLNASNTNLGPEEVIAEIYVNDVLLTSASANAPGAQAIAEGVAR